MAAAEYSGLLHYGILMSATKMCEGTNLEKQIPQLL